MSIFSKQKLPTNFFFDAEKKKKLPPQPPPHSVIRWYRTRYGNGTERAKLTLTQQPVSRICIPKNVDPDLNLKIVLSYAGFDAEEEFVAKTGRL